MKSVVLLSVCLVLSAAASSGAGTYIGGGVGYWIDSKDPVFNARIGFDVAKQAPVTHSIEFEGYTGEDEDGGFSVRLNGLLANYKVSIDVSKNVYIAFGGGLGATRTRAKWWTYSDSATAFTYQLLSTVGYYFTPQWSVDASLRYLNVGKVSMAGINAKVGDDTSIELGVKYRF